MDESPDEELGGEKESRWTISRKDSHFCGSCERNTSLETLKRHELILILTDLTDFAS